MIFKTKHGIINYDIGGWILAIVITAGITVPIVCWIWSWTR